MEVSVESFIREIHSFTSFFRGSLYVVGPFVVVFVGWCATMERRTRHMRRVSDELLQQAIESRESAQKAALEAKDSTAHISRVSDDLLELHLNPQKTGFGTVGLTEAVEAQTRSMSRQMEHNERMLNHIGDLVEWLIKKTSHEGPPPMRPRTAPDSTPAT